MNRMGFKDHFSGHAADYSRFRPGYPPELFAWLAEQAPAPGRAWDCATGSGQAACALASYFEEVVATDASSEQIANARPCRRVHYAVAPAEASGLADRSVDLVTVAQALHWFDLERFYPEARRVMRPGALIAVWTYGIFRLTPVIDAIVDDLYADTLRDHWPPERRSVESGYRDLPFPFAPVIAPAFQMRMQWSLAQLKGYLRTWSAVRRFQAETGRDPVSELDHALAAAWGGRSEREVCWPLALRAGRA